MISVLVNCPGGWSHGLDSPERGEGRWAQNLTRALAKSGRYEVFACSGGNPTWGRGQIVPNVMLLSEGDAARLGPYDVYIDAAWYDNKRPVASARANFHVHFGFERRLGVPFPEGHYLIYVLKRSAPAYFAEGCGNADRTFYLPAPFNDVMAPPDPSKRQIIHTMRGSDAPERRARFETLYDAIAQLRNDIQVPFVWISSAGVEKPRHEQDRVLEMDAAWGIPYNQMRAELRESGLNAAIDGWSNILDCTSLGVPSLAWTGGIDPTAVEIAKEFDLVLEPDSTACHIAKVIERIFTEPGLYQRYTTRLQQAFSDHVEPVTMALFDEIMGKVL